MVPVKGHSFQDDLVRRILAIAELPTSRREQPYTVRLHRTPASVATGVKLASIQCERRNYS